ncbi:MAG: alpha/beta hydrolase fold domain-containing protein [Eisenbergiella sp.]
MAINKAMRTVLKALSYGDINVQSSRAFANIKAIDPLKRSYRTIDTKIYNGAYEVPTRIYLPGEELPAPNGMEGNTLPVLLFLHGGGWVTESVDTYDRVCAGLAKDTGHAVVSVGYRLAPEFPFPAGLEDCYAVAKAIYTNRFLLNTDPSRITRIETAPGAIPPPPCPNGRDRGEFMPQQQFSFIRLLTTIIRRFSPFPSVMENGSDFLLTRQKLCQYLDYYQSSEEDRQNPYFAPILEPDLSKQPGH